MKRWADTVFAPEAPKPLPMDAAACIRALEPLVIDERRERIAKAVAGRTRSVIAVIAVSYTHLTLPTILRV